MVKKIINKLFGRRNGVVDIENDIFNLNQISKTFSDDEQEIFNTVKPFTMTSPERVLALINSIKYLNKRSIKGDFVECGVWRGGSMLAIALTLESLKDEGNDLYLFDTFSGMTEPSGEDVDISGVMAHEQFKQEKLNENSDGWCFAGLSEVKKTMAISNYPENRIHYIAGDVLDTLRDDDNAPDKIALLRLDTDWYESTKHELEVLFPRLVTGGVLIIDDYGHWKGAKQAVDEYFVENGMTISLHEIDYAGRIAIKH